MNNRIHYWTSCSDYVTIMFVFRGRQGPDMSADSEKIFHRSLDLLQFWITDCKRVDFTPKSSLVDMLENFLNTEVLPHISIHFALHFTERTCQSNSCTVTHSIYFLSEIWVPDGGCFCSCYLHNPSSVHYNLSTDGSVKLPACQHIFHGWKSDTTCLEQPK